MNTSYVVDLVKNRRLDNHTIQVLLSRVRGSAKRLSSKFGRLRKKPIAIKNISYGKLK